MDVLNENGTSTYKQERFNYTNIFSNYYKFRGAVDDHKNNCCDGDCGHEISLDNTCIKNRWEHRVLSLILVLIKVNDFLDMYFFSKPDVNFIDFRERLAYELIFKNLDDTDQEMVTKEGVETRSKTQHYLGSAPPFCKYMNGK